MALAVYTLIHVVAFPLVSLLLMYFVLFDPLEFTPLSFMFPNLEAKFSLYSMDIGDDSIKSFLKA